MNTLMLRMPKGWVSPVTLIAAVLVLAGFGLMTLTPWSLILVALGTFGPGIARELGWLNDHDEFQRQAAHQAGYHAMLVVGVVALMMIPAFRTEWLTTKFPGEVATFLVALMWCVWFLSSLLNFYGPQRMARRVLIAFGSTWLLFTIVSNTGSEWTGWTALLLHPLLTLPFFLAAWLLGYWPRVIGVTLIACTAALAHFLGFFRAEHFDLINTGVTLLLFLGPLLASGVVLLTCELRKPEELAE